MSLQEGRGPSADLEKLKYNNWRWTAGDAVLLPDRTSHSAHSHSTWKIREKSRTSRTDLSIQKRNSQGCAYEAEQQ